MTLRRVLPFVTVFFLGVIAGELALVPMLHRGWAREDEYGRMVDDVLEFRRAVSLPEPEQT